MKLLPPTFFVLRTPLLPADSFIGLNEEKVSKLMENAAVREAIQYASPTFLENWDRENVKTPRLMKTAFKYLSRMSGRSVPYGMFAVLGLGKFSNETELSHPDLKKLIRVHQKSGHEVDREFTEKLSNENLLKKSRFFKNPTLKFVTKKQITFYVWDNQSEVRHYRMSHLEIPESVSSFLNHFPSKFQFQDGIKFLRKLGGEKEECEKMLLDMIHEKILLPEFHPSALESFKTTSGSISKSTFTYQELTSTISQKDLDKILKGVEILERCFKYRSHLMVKDEFEFLMENFKLRYDTSFVPVKDFMTQYPLYPKPKMKRFDGEIERFWANKLMEDGNKTAKGWHISLNETDLAELQKIDEKYAQKTYSPPSSLSVMCSISEGSIHIKNIYGPPGQLLLGRFTQDWKSLTDELRKFSQVEEKEYHETIFADLDHYLGAKGTNVSARNSGHRHRIPLIAGGESHADIELDDLYVGLREEKFVLYSKSLDKEVSPRLNIAHNYKKNEMLYYSFLASLCRQDSFGNLNFHLGELTQIRHFPRVSYEGIIFIPESWNLSGQMLQEIIKNNKEGELGIPRFIQLKVGDKNLPFDLASSLSREVFLGELSKLNEVRLEEVIHLENHFFNEIVIPFVHKGVPVFKEKVHLYSPKERMISPAGNSLYFKLYFTARLDVVVIENLKKFLDRNRLTNWFYIHYGDKDYHIRLRFFSLSNSEREKILGLMVKLTSDWLEQGLLWDFRIEPYRPELDSYGGVEGVKVFHQLSHLDSVKAINFIRKRHSTYLHETYLFLIRESVEYLKLLFPDMEERIKFISEYSSEVPCWEEGMLDSIIEEESEAFLIAKTQIQETSFERLPDKARKKWIERFHQESKSGTIKISSDRLYSRMVHLLANRTSLKLFPFHEKRIQILVKNVILKEKHSKRKLS